MFVNAVYYPSWKIYKGQRPSLLNVACITHIIYAFAWVHANGTVNLSDQWADADMIVDGHLGCLNACTALRHATRRMPKVLLSLGGGGEGSEHFAAAARTVETRKRFAITVKEIVLKYDLDGVDINWECPQDEEEGENYVQLLATLRGYLPLERFEVTAALPSNEWALKNIDLSRAASYLNYVNLMTYDFSGPWLNKTGHHAQLYTPEEPHSLAATLSVNYAASLLAVRNVPFHKITLGIPLYGRSFLRTHGVGHSYNGQGGELGVYDYRDLPRPGAQEYVDENAVAAYCIGTNGEFVTYDNQITVEKKAIYARNNRLAGLFYWAGTGDAQGDKSLVRTGYMSLHGF
ncbi:glycoside hydrolase [Pseudovirgaria hyperparasitica]|uniref:chitinase n=1 Tax=Pseudovirgaria hyperparasitica TaxID=470096 RepID=A0A6A6VU37_9PEZI|nr:glycoside hydrolase [Pseudovirgaria hyperparasitica]KAF2754092.1 glycoside hydrolase [Pseudovirgaria hyperparasitica]